MQSRIQDGSKFLSRSDAAHHFLVQSRAEPSSAHSASHDLHVVEHARANASRTHALMVDLPKVPAQRKLCNPGITVCLPCDGADEADTRFLPRVLKSIADKLACPARSS